MAKTFMWDTATLRPLPRIRCSIPSASAWTYTDFSVTQALRKWGERRRPFQRHRGKHRRRARQRGVVQVYCEAPQGKLGKPARTLWVPLKTSLLAPRREGRPLDASPQLSALLFL